MTNSKQKAINCIHVCISMISLVINKEEEKTILVHNNSDIPTMASLPIKIYNFIEALKILPYQI